MAGCAIYITYNISVVYNNAIAETYHLKVEFHCVHLNDTNICLENCGLFSNEQLSQECKNDNDFCISKDKMCNGVLDLFNIQKYHKNVEDSCHDRQYRLAHFFDELFCRKNWIGVYVTIFGTGAIAILCCVAIWILSLTTMVAVFRCLRNAIRHSFCAQIPLTN